TKDIAPPGERPPQKSDRWGFGKGKVEKKTRISRAVRIAVLAASFIGCVSYGWLARTNRGLDANDYAVPMLGAQLVHGTFAGTLDESRWFALRWADREKAVRQLEAQLKDRGLVGSAQIRNAAHQLVIAGGGTRLHAAPFLMRDRLVPGDPTVPKDFETMKPQT